MPANNKEQNHIEMGGLTLHPNDRIGSYRYERPIGRGGMADVLLAYDPNGHPMALKVLKASRFKTGLRRFRREFRALAKLKHPNVIQVDSYGDIFGHPYFAMEYVEGIDLHKTIRNFRNYSLEARWKRVEEILIDLSKGLAYIHRRGLVHRDLKPSNVLINKEGVSKITDFGIVKTLNPDHDALASSTLVGTWAYASPEQICGRSFDHRSDLYSLGVILYAMLTGRRPFAADNMAGYLKLHRDQPPKPPSDFIPEIPKNLEKVCLQLLQKSPQDRIQSAKEILEILGEAPPSSITSQSLIKPWIVPLGGRKEVIDQFNLQLQSLANGAGAVLQLTGKEGFGKSRMLDEMESLVQKLEFPLFQYSLSPNKSPLETTLQIANHIAKEAGDNRLNTAIRALEQTKGEKEADLRYQLFDYSRDALSKLLEERPQIFLLDNLHHAQLPLREFLLYLSKTLLDRQSLPLLFVVTTEQKLSWLPNHQSFPLPPLSTPQIEAVLRKMCSNTDHLMVLAKKLQEETEGIPLFLAEFIQSMLHNGQIISGDPYRLAQSPQELASCNFDIPPGIRQLAHQYFEKLSKKQKPIVHLLAVAGREMDIDTLLDCIEGDEEELLDSIDDLQKTGFILSHQIGIDPILELARRKFGEVIYEDLPIARRITIHKKIATILESRGVIGVSAAQQIGEHYRLAQESGKAYQFLATATLRLWERGLAAESLSLLDRAAPLMRNAKNDLATKDFLTARLQLLKVQSGVAKNRGAWRDAAKTLRSMIRYAREVDNWQLLAEAELSLGNVALQLNQLEVGERRIRAVLNHAEKRGEQTIMISALHHLCASAWQRGDLDTCETIAKLGLSKTKKGETTVSRARILLSLSAVQAARGQLKKAAQNMQEASQIFTRLVRKEKNATVLCNLAEMQIWQGEWRAALNNIKLATTLSQNTMYRRGEAQALITHAMALFSLGMIEDALPLLHEGLRLSKELTLPDNLIVARLLLGKIALFKKEPKIAQSHLLYGLRHSNSSDPEHYFWALQALQSQALSTQKQSKKAQRLLDEIEENLPLLPWPRRIETMLYCAQARANCKEKKRATQLANFAYQKALELGMKGWALEALGLLAKHAISNKKAIQLLQNMLAQFSINLNPKQASKLKTRF